MYRDKYIHIYVYIFFFVCRLICRILIPCMVCGLDMRALYKAMKKQIQMQALIC